MGFTDQIYYFFTNPNYLEAINQMRGASDSLFGKLFFNKLLYGYFYLQNMASFFDLYFWIEKIGLLAVVLFILGLLKMKKMPNKLLLIIFGLLLLPVGLLHDKYSTYYFIVFIPFIVLVVYKFLMRQSMTKRYILTSLVVLNIVLQYWLSIQISI